MKDCIISIIIPCYNHGEYLEETLSSIASSTKKYVPEIIIVNDGSTDLNTLEIFKKLESEGYFILHQENQGLAKARNNGIRISKGKYILPLDSDNNVCFHYLNTAIDLLEQKSEVDIVYGNALYIGEKNGIWKNHNLDPKKILFTNHIDACAVFRKDTWNNVGGYSEDMPYMGTEDWNFWLKCINVKKEFYFLNEVCFEYRVLSTSMIRNTPEDYNTATLLYNMNQLIELYKKSMIDDYNVIQSVFFGSLFRKISKLTLNHFGKYKY